MELKNEQVEKIIQYLEGKIANIKKKLVAYESPIMQDMTKSSTHLQMDYIRLSSELSANEDNLLAIQNFSSLPVTKKAEDGKEKGKRKAGAAKKDKNGTGVDTTG